MIGTGIYLDDVRQEIGRVQRSVVQTLLAVSALVALLLLRSMQQSLRIERERSDAEEALRTSNLRYRSLADATTEGTLLVLEGRCRYANPIFLSMVGYEEAELGMLDLADLLPEGPGNEDAWALVRGFLSGERDASGFDGLLRRRDGSLVDCVLALSHILGREASSCWPGRETQQETLGDGARRANEGWMRCRRPSKAGVGLFRARANAQGTVAEVSPRRAGSVAPPGYRGPSPGEPVSEQPRTRGS